jgi:hypothetical protein
MATIARLVVEISAKTAEFKAAMRETLQATRDTQRQLETSANAVKALEDRFNGLKRGFRTGVVGEQEFANAMKTLKADVAELATQGTLAEKSLDRLAKVGAGATRELNNVTRAAKQSAQGFEAFGIVTLASTQLATGGIVAVTAAASTLGNFARGNPWMIGILTGLGLLASAWSLIRDKTKDAADEAERYNGINRVRLQARLAENQAALARAGANTPAIAAFGSGGVGGAANVVANFLANRNSGNANVARLVTENAALTTAINVLDTETAHAARTAKDHAIALHGEADAVRGLISALKGLDLGKGEEIGAIKGKGDLGKRMFEMAQQAAAWGVMVMNVARSVRNTVASAAHDQVKLGSTIASAVVSMASQIGQGLAQGANFFKLFAKSAVASIGSIISAIGQMLIAKGIGDIIRTLPFAGPAAIAVGAGLVALGSAMGGGNGRSAGSVGGGSSGGGGFSSSPGSSSSGDGGRRGGTFIIQGEPRDVITLDTLAGMLRELGYNRIVWQPA